MRFVLPIKYMQLFCSIDFSFLKTTLRQGFIDPDNFFVDVPDNEVRNFLSHLNDEKLKTTPEVNLCKALSTTDLYSLYDRIYFQYKPTRALDAMNFCIDKALGNEINEASISELMRLACNSSDFDIFGYTVSDFALTALYVINQKTPFKEFQSLWNKLTDSQRDVIALFSQNSLWRNGAK